MESEIRSWLKTILKEDIDNFAVNILGNSEKGDGYLGDIVFVSLTPAHSKSNNKYDLVLKCSKRSETLRKTSPVKEAFMNEIYMYDQVIPAFQKFQLEKNIEKKFESVPKYYGRYTSDTMEIIVFENLKKRGYTLWNKKRPLTRNHINMVLEQYANFHSISIAMKEQKPKEFQEMTEHFNNILKKFLESADVKSMFGKNVEEIYELLKGDLDDNVLEVWRSLAEKIEFIFIDMFDQENGLKVLLHGDCWCNNFMFKYEVENPDLPLNVAIIDWQISRCSSPIVDVSYFLFAGISEQDVEDFDDILDFYYDRLKFYSAKLGTDLNSIYSKKKFLEDWKKYCKFGILMAALIYKICVTEKEEVIDLVQAAEGGQDLGAAFSYDVKNKDAFKKRARYIVKYVVEQELI